MLLSVSFIWRSSHKEFRLPEATQLIRYHSCNFRLGLFGCRVASLIMLHYRICCWRQWRRVIMRTGSGDNLPSPAVAFLENSIFIYYSLRITSLFNVFDHITPNSSHSPNTPLCLLSLLPTHPFPDFTSSSSFNNTPSPVKCFLHVCECEAPEH